jgi:hypothetical protein
MSLCSSGLHVLKGTRLQTEDKYVMVRAVLMTNEQIAELVALAREDSAFWEEIKARELEIEKWVVAAEQQGLDVFDRALVIDPPAIPTLGMMVSDLVNRRYGPENILDTGSLTVGIRLAARDELGLPV